MYMFLRDERLLHPNVSKKVRTQWAGILVCNQKRFHSGKMIWLLSLSYTSSCQMTKRNSGGNFLPPRSLLISLWNAPTLLIMTISMLKSNFQNSGVYCWNNPFYFLPISYFSWVLRQKMLSLASFLIFCIRLF